MKKLLCILSFVFTGIINLSAQAELHSVYQIKHAFDFYIHNDSRTELSKSARSINDIQGSPYLNDEFVEGTVYTTSRVQFMGVPLRYNIYNDQVEFRNEENQIYAISAPEVIEKIEMGDVQMEYVPVLSSTKISNGYLVVLEKGVASLYCRQKVILEQAQSAGAYQTAKPARFIRRSDEYYIRIGKDAAKPVLKKKDLQNAFPNKIKEINAFIKANKVKPANVESLKELVSYYNSLQ